MKREYFPKMQCGVSNQFCKDDTKTICFACGNPVCTRCSSIRKYYNYGKVRLCDGCQEVYDGNSVLVYKRYLKMVG